MYEREQLQQRLRHILSQYLGRLFRLLQDELNLGIHRTVDREELLLLRRENLGNLLLGDGCYEYCLCRIWNRIMRLPAVKIRHGDRSML